VIALFALLVGCNRGSGLATFPPVTPAQTGVVASRIAATAYYVELHPLDAPDLPMLEQLHDTWHARGIRIDYEPGYGNAFYDTLVSNAKKVKARLLALVLCDAAHHFNCKTDRIIGHIVPSNPAHGLPCLRCCFIEFAN
jgi:hypothetical protein